MAHLKSMIAGLGIGVAGALLARKLIKRSGVAFDWTHDHWREGQLEPEDSRSETHVPNFAGVRENTVAPGRTVSKTESELRRQPTNPVHYTTDPSASPASGGTAPFLKKKKA